MHMIPFICFHVIPHLLGTEVDALALSIEVELDGGRVALACLIHKKL